MLAGRLGKLLFALPWLCLSLAGCRSNATNQELLESELRARDFQYRDAVDELKKIESHNHALQRELMAIRQGSAARIPPETASQIYSLKRITLGRGTGGYDADGVAGDEALQVVIEPRDGDDHVIKAPGSVGLTAYDISPEGLKMPVSTWELDAERLRRTWKSGLLNNGYFVIVPWQKLPSSEKVRVVVRFVLPDGRAFEADKDVRVRVMPGQQPHPPLPGDGPVLPPPAPLFPEQKDEPEKKLPEQTSRRLPNTPLTPAHDWQPAPLSSAIEFGRPTPMQPAATLSRPDFTPDP